jgi:subtilisin family serine protease
VLAPEAAEVQDSQKVLSFPEAGVEVYRVPVGPSKKSLEDRKRNLRMSPDIRFAGGVLVDDKTSEPVIYTENLFVKFVDNADREESREVLRQAGLIIKEELGYATNAFFVGAPEGIGTQVFDIAERLLARDDVEYCHPELVRKAERRAIFPQQWHLKSTTINGVAINASARIDAAHLATQGQGVTIAVIDDGVDIDHAEFASSGKIVAPRDASQQSADPRPKASGEKHGTACAGVACGDGVLGASGVAPKARLMPIRLSSALGSMQEAKAFEWAANNGADVISCSWGPADGDWFDPADPVHTAPVPLPASTKLAIDFATEQGRGGKGCIVLFAAGNGRESVSNDGYASYEKVIAVAACNDTGKRSVYSDFGPAVLCSFPSSDFGHPPFSQPNPLTTGIWTTDRSGIAAGYNRGVAGQGDAAGNFTNSFGGTSSACPGAAGVAALVLSVNPNLTRLQVRDILGNCCDRIDPQGGQYNAAGHSDFYGFGRLNAEVAVRLAAPSTQPGALISRQFNEFIPDLGTITVTLEVAQTEVISSLAVPIDIQHTFIGDLVVTLIPPAALGVANIVLHNRTGGGTKNLKKTYDASTTPALAAIGGRSINGTWSLRIRDAEAQDQGTLVSFGLDMKFQAAIPHVVQPPPRMVAETRGLKAPKPRAAKAASAK